jgi:hypothetical protein
MKTTLTLVLFGATLLPAQAPIAKQQVHSIYVSEFHSRQNPDFDGIVRSKLISSLAQKCASNCTVMEIVSGDGDVADAVLQGDMLVHTNGIHYRVQGAMRLVTKDGAVLWAATIYSSPLARSATSSFADNVASKIASFLAGDRKSK